MSIRRPALSTVAALLAITAWAVAWAGAVPSEVTDETLAGLVLSARTGEYWKRAEAVSALGALRDPRALDTLVAALATPNETVRRAAVGALAQWGGPRVVKGLMQALHSDDQRAAAAEALVQLGDPRTVAAVAAALRDGDERVARAASGVLERIGGPAVVGVLLEALRDRRPSVRERARGALGRVDPSWPERKQTRAQLGAFVLALLDQDPGVRASAREVLERMAPPWAKDRAAAGQTGSVVAALRGRDAGVRDSALWALGQIDPDWPRGAPARAQVPEFIAALRHPDAGVRAAASEWLERIDPNWPQHPRAASQARQFIAALGSKDAAKDAGLRLAVVGVLARLRVPAAFDPLARRLADSDSRVRAAAAKALAALNDSRAPGRLAPVLRDPEPAVRTAVVEALARIGGEQTLEPLLGAAADADPVVQVAAVGALAERADPRALTTFITAAASADPRVRRAAVAGLARLPEPRSVTALIGLIEDRDQTVGSSATEALVAFGPLVLDVLTAPGDAIPPSPQLLALLGRLGDPRAAGLLLSALRTGRWDLRQPAADALVAIGPGTVPVLVTAVLDPNVGVRGAVRAVLERIDPSWFKQEEARRRLGAWVGALADTNPGVRAAAAELLDLSTPQWRQGPEAARQVDACIARLGVGHDLQARISAAEALGVVREPRAVGPLMAVLTDPVQPALLVQAVATALVGIGDPALVPLIEALPDPKAEVRRPALAALDRIDPTWAQRDVALARTESLVALSAFTDAALRSDAAAVLGRIGGTHGEHFTTALERADPAVRRGALAGLIGLGRVPHPARTYPAAGAEAPGGLGLAVAATLGAAHQETAWGAAWLALGTAVRLAVDPRFYRESGVLRLDLFLFCAWLTWTIPLRRDLRGWTWGWKGFPAALALVLVLAPVLAIAATPDPPLPRSLLLVPMAAVLAALVVPLAALPRLVWHPDWSGQRLMFPALAAMELLVLHGAALAFVLLGIGLLQHPAIGWGNSLLFAGALVLVTLIAAAAAPVVMLLPALPGGLRWRRAEQRARAFFCPLHLLRRFRLGPGLPWLVRWSGRALAVETPCPHRDFADYLHCEACEPQHPAARWEGVAEVVGRIGGSGPGRTGCGGAADLLPVRQGDRVTIALWDEATQKAQDADIDRLEILCGGVANYDKALHTVINILRGDSARRRRWFRRVRVGIDPAVDLSPAAHALLKDAFGKAAR